MITLATIRAALAASTHPPAPFAPHPRHAAVAMILRGGGAGLEACFIRRAERAGDPWSGQVAFPGGRASPGDADAAAVAERETREEIGLELARADQVGMLPAQPVRRAGVHRDMTLSPFLYHVDGGRAEQARPLLPVEVADVFWVPLEHLFDERAGTWLRYPPTAGGSHFPGIQFGEHVIWGLTLRVLGSFAALLDRRLPALA